MKLYTWNENCVRAGEVDGAYEPEDLFEIQIRNDGPGAIGQSPWAADRTGDNEPRSYDVCLSDMAGLVAMRQSPYAHCTVDRLGDTWRIHPTGDTRCDGDHTEHDGTEEELIDDARETLGASNASAFRRKAAKNILEHLRPGEYGWDGSKVD